MCDTKLANKDSTNFSLVAEAVLLDSLRESYRADSQKALESGAKEPETETETEVEVCADSVTVLPFGILEDYLAVWESVWQFGSLFGSLGTGRSPEAAVICSCGL